MVTSRVDVWKSRWSGECDFASSYINDLMINLKTRSREKSNKYNQCDCASSQASNLRQCLKTHTGEKSNKCNRCEYPSSRADFLRAHLKIHSGEKSNKFNQWLGLFSGRQFEDIFWKRTMRKVIQIQCNHVSRPRVVKEKTGLCQTK